MDEKWLRSKINGLGGIIMVGGPDPGPRSCRQEMRMCSCSRLCDEGYLELGVDGRYEQVCELVSSNL